MQPVTAQFFTLEGRPYRAIPTSRLSVVVQFSDRSRLGSSPRLRLYFTVLRARAPLCPLHVWHDTCSLLFSFLPYKNVIATCAQAGSRVNGFAAVSPHCTHGTRPAGTAARGPLSVVYGLAT